MSSLTSVSSLKCSSLNNILRNDDCEITILDNKVYLKAYITEY